MPLLASHFFDLFAVSSSVSSSSMFSSILVMSFLNLLFFLFRKALNFSNNSTTEWSSREVFVVFSFTCCLCRRTFSQAVIFFICASISSSLFLACFLPCFFSSSVFLVIFLPCTFTSLFLFSLFLSCFFFFHRWWVELSQRTVRAQFTDRQKTTGAAGERGVILVDKHSAAYSTLHRDKQGQAGTKKRKAWQLQERNPGKMFPDSS